MIDMKRLAAAVLVVALILSLSATALAAPSGGFIKADADSANGMVYARFRSNLCAYTRHSITSKSNIIIRKGSLAQVKGVYGKKWVKLRLVTSLTLDHTDLEMWFMTDRLTRVVDPDFVLEPYHPARYRTKITFSSGGSGATWQRDVTTDPKLTGKKVKTTGKVNLRKTASLAGKSCGTVKKGKTVTLNGKVGIDCRDVVFFGVTVGKKDYFLSSLYLDIKGYKYKFSEGYDDWIW